jgi:hypothetical protein
VGYSFKGKLAGGFYSVPHWPHDKNAMSRLSGSASTLWHFFYRVLNRVGSPRFSVSECVIRSETGMSPKTIRTSRAELTKCNLVTWAPDAKRGGPCVYHLVNPETNEPFPVERRGVPVYDPGKEERLKAAFVARQNAPQRAPRGARTHRETSSGSQPSPATPPIEIAHRTAADDTSPLCKKHGNAFLSFPKDGATYCGLCKRDPNAPPNAYPKYHRFAPVSSARIRGSSCVPSPARCADG